MPEGGCASRGADASGDAHAAAEPLGDARAFDMSSLFAHDDEVAADAEATDEVGVLFGAQSAHHRPGQPAQDLASELHLQSAATSIDDAAGHLFDDADMDAHLYTRSLPAPAPARVDPQHAAPRYGIRRPQLIAMAVGLVITGIGVGWSLTTPVAPSPVVASPAPTATVDSERLAKIKGEVGALAAEVVSAQAQADSFAEPLAAMAGSSDEAARLAAEAARHAYAAAIAAVKVPELSVKHVTNASLDTAERDVSAAKVALGVATTGFRNAMTTFRQSVPSFAAIAVEENADAAESFRVAATAAAATVAAADPFGPTPFVAMDAWRSALAALVADQARAIAEADQRDSEGSDGSAGSGAPGETADNGGGATTEPPAAPVPTPPSPPTDPQPIPTGPADTETGP